MSSSGWGKDWICLVALLSQVGLVDLLAHAYIFAIFLCLFCVFLKNGISAEERRSFT